MTWQYSLKDAITSPADITLLDTESRQFSPAAHGQFPLRVPPAFADLIDPDNPDDPLLRQVFPDVREDEPVAGFGADPLNEQDFQPAPGILHKYHGRVLLLLTAACAIHCRYCFRRHFPYSDSNPLNSHWPATLDYLRTHDDVREVIFSGGDPLMLDDEKLTVLVRDLETIPHLRRLRIHTRMPVAAPERINPEFIDLLAQSRLRPVVVVHVNHAQELGVPARRAIRALRNAGVTLLNQSVLLRAINDSAAVLVELSESLFELGVMPYYLHLLDPVAGAAHFRVDKATAKRLHTEIQKLLPGYLVPRLVREVAGFPNKQLLV
jgi:EF-P beta-lysylation protein EpmB